MSGTIKILIVLTSHALIGNTGHSTGVWFEELTTPYYAFIDAGAAVDIVSIEGGKVPIDPASLKAADHNPGTVDRFLKDASAMPKIGASPKISEVSAEGYDAVFLPGGHGTMWDLPESTALAALLSKAWDDGMVVAAVCHGPAGLVNARNAAGSPIVAGRRVAAFSNAEEDAAGFAEAMPFLLESRIRDLGARYESSPNFQPFAVRNGRLVTGQNPASSEETARLPLDAVKATGR